MGNVKGESKRCQTAARHNGGAKVTVCKTNKCGRLQAAVVKAMVLAKAQHGIRRIEPGGLRTNWHGK